MGPWRGVLQVRDVGFNPYRLTFLPIIIPPIVPIVGVLQLAPGFLKSTPYLLSLEYVVLTMPFAYRAIDAELRALDLETIVESANSLGAAGSTRCGE